MKVGDYIKYVSGYGPVLKVYALTDTNILVERVTMANAWSSKQRIRHHMAKYYFVFADEADALDRDARCAEVNKAHELAVHDLEIARKQQIAEIMK